MKITNCLSTILQLPIQVIMKVFVRSIHKGKVHLSPVGRLFTSQEDCIQFRVIFSYFSKAKKKKKIGKPNEINTLIHVNVGSSCSFPACLKERAQKEKYFPSVVVPRHLPPCPGLCVSSMLIVAQKAGKTPLLGSHFQLHVTESSSQMQISGKG